MVALAILAILACCIACLVYGWRSRGIHVVLYAAGASACTVLAGYLADRMAPECDASDCWTGIGILLALCAAPFVGFAALVAGLVAALLARGVRDVRERREGSGT